MVVSLWRFSGYYKCKTTVTNIYYSQMKMIILFCNMNIILQKMWAWNLSVSQKLVFQEVTEKMQSMRFQLQLSRVEDQKTPILSLQESVRSAHFVVCYICSLFDNDNCSGELVVEHCPLTAGGWRAFVCLMSFKSPQLLGEGHLDLLLSISLAFSLNIL